jgi:hypothetical protein
MHIPLGDFHMIIPHAFPCALCPPKDETFFQPLSPLGEVHSRKFRDQPTLLGLTKCFRCGLIRGSSRSGLADFNLVIGDYKMAKAATLPKVSLDSKFKVGRKSYTMADAIAQGVACYDQLYLIQEDQLNLYRELGNILLQIEALFGGDKKAYGSFISTTDMSNENISNADKYDAKWIATHWTKVQSLNKSGKLSALGVSSIRKIVLEAHPELRKKPKNNSAGNTSKGKGGDDKQPSKAEEVIKNTVFETVVAKDEKELAEQVFDALQAGGFKRSEFAKELAKLFKK